MIKLKYVSYFVCLSMILFIMFSNGGAVFAQGAMIWSPQQRIPGYDDSTEPPILIADQDNIVHAFSSQWMGASNTQSALAIIYSQWTLKQGWTQPNDILLSPLKQIAQILDVFLDQSGIVHLIFYGGDSTNANIYYSSAPIINADEAAAWSEPTLIGSYALAPGSAAIVGDNKGNLIILYAGIEDGNGVYETSSSDNGNDWSNPSLIYLAPNNQPNISALKIVMGQSGWLHAIWNVLDKAGQGRGVYYSRYRIGEAEWSEPENLAETASGYGVLTPAIIEFQDTVFVLYNVTPKIYFRLSNDLGQTWSDPVNPFPNYTGVNGSLSLVIDGSNNLHLFFGQRIPGNPDTHGMWHSVWRKDTWSTPDSVVSGPRNMSGGDKAFDPFNARAVVSQGNTILVTWRTDPGNGVKNENGVWYSYEKINAKALPVKPLPTLQSTAAASLSTTNAPTPQNPVNDNTELSPSDRNINASLVSNLNDSTGPLTTIGFGLVPVILAIFIIIYSKRKIHR
jgi:hypothetical protein